MRLRDFTKIMNESVGRKTASVVFAQLNPITPQERVLIESAKEWARLKNADLIIFSPDVHNHTKSPLTFTEKQQFFEENLGYCLTQTNSLFESIQHLRKHSYVNAKLFLPEEIQNSAHILTEHTNYEVANVDVHDNEKTRADIIEHVLNRIYIGEEFQNHDTYFHMISSRCMVNLKENVGYVGCNHAFEVDHIVENVVNGDIAKVLSIGKRIFCESLISGTPEWYDPNDLVDGTRAALQSSVQLKPPSFQDIIEAVSHHDNPNTDK